MKDFWTIKNLGSYYAPNTVELYSGTDNLENIQKYNPDRVNDTSIEYRYNSHGLRTIELIPDFSKFRILVSGCSITMGIGMNPDDCWPSILASKIPNSQLFNVAHGGASFDYVVRSIYTTIDIVKPDLVCVLIPEKSRFEMCRYQRPYVMTVQNDNYPKFLLDESFHDYRHQKNIIFLNMLCELKKTPLLYNYYFDFVIIDGNLARDGIHYGTQYHEKTANAFFDQFKKINN